jgi:hypothetical protein
VNIVNQMFEAGYSVEEIAENLSEFECVEDYDMESKQCNENKDCNDCWNECLNKIIKEEN